MLKTTALTDDEENDLKNLMPKYEKGNYVRISAPTRFLPGAKPGSSDVMEYVMPKRNSLEVIKNMEVYDDDLFIVTPPKCGTTWTQEIVWLMLNNVDTEGAKINQFYRIPFLEIDSLLRQLPKDEWGIYPENLEKNEENIYFFEAHSIEYIQRLKRPRAIKTHLPISFLPDKVIDKCKIIFVARNVKDAVVSYYHHFILMGSSGMVPCREDFPLFAKLAKNQTILQSSATIKMMLEGWELRKTHPNVLFFTYEDMSRNLDDVLSKLSTHLNVKLSDEKLNLLKKQVGFTVMQKNVFVNKSKEIPHDPDGEKRFIRKGKVGDWKNHFTPDMNAEWDAWIQHELQGTDYKMEFEI